MGRPFCSDLRIFAISESGSSGASERGQGDSHGQPADLRGRSDSDRLTLAELQDRTFDCADMAFDRDR
jgi:hypothetical protein